MNTPKFLIIHGSDVSYKKVRDQFKSINAYHRDERKFPQSSLGFYVGYQYLYTGGKEYLCRADTDEGAHTNQIVNGVSMNFQSIGLCVGFDGDIEYMPEPEYTLLKKRVHALQDWYKIPNSHVKFHRDFHIGKTCPGSLITKDWLDELLERDPAFKPIDQTIKQREILSCEARLKNQESIIYQLLRKLNII